MSYSCLRASCIRRISSYHPNSFLRQSCRPVSISRPGLGKPQRPQKRKPVDLLVAYTLKNKNVEWEGGHVTSPEPEKLELLKDKKTGLSAGGYRPGGEPWKRSWMYLPKGMNIRAKRKLELHRSEDDKSPATPQRQGGTHLHWAVDPWKEMEVRILLDKGIIDINRRNDDGSTALHLVAQQNLPDAAQLLLDYGADVNITDRRGYTPLHCAVLYKAKDMIEPLIDADADIEARNREDDTPICIAVRRNSMKIAKMLFEKGASVKPLEGGKSSVIHLATQLRRKHLLGFLLDKGGDINFQDQYGKTPLHYAAEKNEYKGTFMLLKRGAKIDTQDLKGNTALHLALNGNHEKTIAVLVQMGADATIPNPNGGIPDPELIRLAQERRIYGVEELQMVGLRTRRKLSGQGKKATPQMGVGENWEDKIFEKKEAKRLKNRALRLQRIDDAKKLAERWKSPYIFPGSESEKVEGGRGDRLDEGGRPEGKTVSSKSKQRGPAERRGNSPPKRSWEGRGSKSQSLSRGKDYRQK